MTEPNRQLDPSETVAIEAHAHDAFVVVTDKRLAVASRLDRFDLDIPPERPADRPQVLSIPPDQYEVVGQALAVVGRHLFGGPNEAVSAADTDLNAVGDDGQVFGG